MNGKTISRILTRNFPGADPISLDAVSGGDINQAYKVQFAGRRFFAKINSSAAAPAMFRAEAHALNCLRGRSSLCVPEPLGVYEEAGSAMLLMEHLDLASVENWAELGRGLARLHQMNGPAYGWDHDNFIGTTPQSNSSCSSWADFWWRSRLEPQLELAMRNGFAKQLRPLAADLERKCHQYLADHHPPAALLHGDLWRGNVGFLKDGRAAIFDPASYYGDPEVDLSMTRLFGGFAADFYRAYAEVHPQLPDADNRAALYNLYHLLNHLNLFGGGYLSGCLRTMDEL
jgi:protein-ribulosamine 3-kinase